MCFIRNCFNGICHLQAFGKKGFVKKSIFKTPENAKGRVGVGTCGVGGRDVTEFDERTKHKKGL